MFNRFCEWLAGAILVGLGVLMLGLAVALWLANLLAASGV